MNLLDKARTLPKLAGCYLMKNKHEEVIYVGKAKELTKRVISYFNNSTKTPKTEVLVSHIYSFDFIITETELEALVLENNLIKRHSPKYNIRLRDDKSYPYIVINKRDPFARLEYKRRVKRSRDFEVFGPFATGSNISEVLRILIKSFNLRDCSDYEFKTRKVPCLLYQMKQCSAPCVSYINEEQYKIELDLALDIFKRKGRRSLKFLEEKMQSYAVKEEFEHAAIIRDNLATLYEFVSYSSQKNAELKNIEENIDVVSYHIGDLELDLSIYMVRNGLLLGNKNFHFPLIDCDDELEDEIVKYILQYYSESHDSLPEIVVMQLEKQKIKSLDEALKLLNLSSKLKVILPAKKYESLTRLVTIQAKESQRIRIANQDSVYIGLNKLKDLLSLIDRPRRLECFDVAVWQGKSPTASQIVYVDGKAVKKDYRYYHLQERPEGNNDFAMMKEMLLRRLKKKFLPDVFIVDGGKGQVSVFVGVLKELEIDIPVVGIAKSKVKGSTKTEERLIIPGRLNPYILKKNISLFRIITSMRDEAHRFSRKLHHKAESERTFNSWLDEISGIGPKRKKTILTKLDLPKEELKKLSFKELESKLEVSKNLVQRIYDHLQQTN